MTLFSSGLRAGLGLAAGIAVATAPMALAAPNAVTETRNCAWAVKIDPNGVNALFPDQAARYWVLDLPAAPNTSLTITGQFPHARYTSFTSYDTALRSADGLPDVSIAPDKGSINPFVAGAWRPAKKRNYTVHVIQGAPPRHRAKNTLYTSSSDGQRTGTTFLVALRIYEPDRGYGDNGGVALPTVAINSASGTTTLPGCEQPTAPTGTNKTLSQQSAPYRNSGGSDKAIDWHKFYNLPSAFAMATGQKSLVGAARSTTPKGGFADNPDNKYVSAVVSTATAPAIVIHARLPITPVTYRHERRMQPAQLRYWSMCSNELATERFWGCVMDDQLPLAADHTYTIVVTAAADRPKNARPGCGIAWLPAGSGEDTVLIERNMLPDAAFPHSIQAARYDHEQHDLGAYYPTAHYESIAQVEKLGCHAPAVAPQHQTESQGEGR
ncbi:MAG: hypothetical protein JO222_11340 [Frankiales bacterium]|nr:hypothetical protein [Frankiales bacterium]